MTPAETDTQAAPETAEPTEAPAAPQVAEPEEAAAPSEPVSPPETTPEQTDEAQTPSAPQVAEADAPAAAQAAEAEADTPAAPPAEEAAPAPRPNRQADRRKQLEELSRSTAAELGREPDRRVVEKAILSAGGPDAVREFLATPQESREGKPLGWRIACLREARRHEPGGKAETGWVTLSAVPVRQIRNALDRAVDADGRIMFRDEPVDTGRGDRGGRPGSRGGGRGGDRPGGGRGRRPRGDDRAIADEFLEGGVASFGEGSGRKNPFAALSGLLDEDDKK